ncbi:MAG: host-nuclease inhibitor Gam family protein [Deltaproteobacteria bacterium]|nr:host-nuclease inhibitor Gam family protein [Deltaproteobacteria bacterium]
MATMQEIENATRSYAVARKELAMKCQALEEEIAQAKKRHLGAIKKSVEVAKTYQSRLGGLIEDSAELFSKPRTAVFYGIKVGFQKGKGGLAWDDDSHVVKLVKKLFPDQAETLIKVAESPAKAALAQLPAADLKRLGIEVIDSGDQVLIKPTDSEVDKLVNALLRDETKEVREAA